MGNTITHIILGGDNLNSLGIIRSLGEVGIRPIIILYKEGHIKLVPHSRYAKQVFWVDSIEEGVALMYKYASKDCRPFVYTTDDNTESYLDLHYDELIQHFHFYNAGEAGRITHLMDKKAICDLAEECGFNVPKGEVVSRGELPKDIKYPVITKTLNPYSPGWKRDVGIYYNDEELAEAYKGMISEKLLLQEYIQKKNELAIQGIAANNGETVLLTYYYSLFRFTDTSFGGYKHYHIISDIDLIDKIKVLISKIRFNGLFEIEFIINQDNSLSFLEVNFRSSGANYAMTYGNVNLPYLWTEMVLSQRNSMPELRQESFNSMKEPLDFEQSVMTHKLSIIRWFNDFLKSDSHDLFNKKDPAPFCAFILSKFGKKLKKIRIGKKMA